MMSPHATIRTRQEGDTQVVYVGGYLNSLLGEEVERAVRSGFDSGCRKVLMNFGQTRLVNSIGISFIIGIVEKVMEGEGKLAFCEVSRINRDLFQVTGLSKYVRSFETEKEGLEFLSGAA